MDEIVQYPKWMYHATEPACVVASEEERDALGEGWGEAPVDPIKPEIESAAGTGNQSAPAAPNVVLDKMTKAQLADFAKTDLQLELDVDVLTKAQMIDAIQKALQ